MNNTRQSDRLQLDETDERKFRHGATGYGVELYGGSVEDRTAAVHENFDEPLVTVDCRDVDSDTEMIDTALKKLGVDEDQIDRLSMSGYDLRETIEATDTHFVILEFDALDFVDQRSVARTMKGVAEGLESDDIMFGYTTSVGGKVVSAEPDLSARIRSWQVGEEENVHGPLSDFSSGDEIQVSARETPMEVVDMETGNWGQQVLTAENHHGTYELESHDDGSVTLTAGRERVPDVEVDHAE